MEDTMLGSLQKDFKVLGRPLTKEDMAYLKDFSEGLRGKRYSEAEREKILIWEAIRRKISERDKSSSPHKS